MLHLQCYDVVVICTPERDLNTVNTVFRALLTHTTLSEVDRDIDLYCNFVASNMEILFADIDMIRGHSDRDETFVRIMTYVRNGWPKNRKEIELDVAPYYRLRMKYVI